MLDSAASSIGGVYVFNSSSLIKLERSKGLRVLYLLEGEGRVIVPHRVAREVNKPRKPLETWLKRNPKSVKQFLPEEGRLYLEFLRQTQPKIHDGEAAALAIALHRGCTLVADDGPTMEKARQHGVECIDTRELLGRPLL